MSLFRLAASHPDLACAFFVVVFQSFALVLRGKDHLFSSRGLLDLLIWVLGMSAVVLRGRSAIATAHLLDKLKLEAEQTLQVSQRAQMTADDAFKVGQSATAKARGALQEANGAGRHATAALSLSKRAGKQAVYLMELVHVAQSEIDAQHRSLRSVHIEIELHGEAVG